MTKENKNKQVEVQTTDSVQEVQKVAEKKESAKEAVVAQNSKMVSDDVIIEIVHAFKEIIIEFIHRKYQIPSKQKKSLTTGVESSGEAALFRP